MDRLSRGRQCQGRHALQTASETLTTRYFHTDHLGSVYKPAGIAATLRVNHDLEVSRYQGGAVEPLDVVDGMPVMTMWKKFFPNEKVASAIEIVR